MTNNVSTVNSEPYPTDAVGECAIARIFVAQKFIECGLIDEARFCLEQVTHTFPWPKEQYLHAAFKAATSKAITFRGNSDPDSDFCIELYQGGRQ